MSALPQVRLKIERRSSHPWIFQKMVEKPATKLPGGAVVDILDRTGQWVGRGFYNGHSRISLRVLTTDHNEAVDEAFFQRRIGAAVAFRRDTLKLDAVTTGYRLVFSEGDGLSGLVVDRFADVIVIEYFAAGPWRFRQVIQDALAKHFPESRFYWFAEEHVQKQESFDCYTPEPPPPVIVTEHGLRFRVAAGAKHKTGFFADQRDNRRMLAELSAGRRVLDLCCNTGGFAVYARSLGGASEVIGVDLDEEALELARQNANLNQAVWRARSVSDGSSAEPGKLGSFRFVQADLFPWLRDAIARGERYDVVILDPAKQTRDRDEVGFALKRYLDMNKLAIQAVAPGGVLLTCSCTGLVSEEDFLECLRRAAWQASRSLQVFRVSGAAPDHPFLAHVREGRYLKAVWGRVE